MSAWLDVEALKSNLTDGTTLENYRLHRKFLAKVFALAHKKPTIKHFLVEKGFYLPTNNPKQKRAILRKNSKEFLKLLQREDFNFLVPKKFIDGTQELRDADKLLEADNRDLRNLPYLLNVKKDLELGVDKGEINKYLKSVNGIFEIFITSSEVEREINEGMTVDIRHIHAKESAEKDNYWKLHVNIDMSKDSKNTQEKVDIAYNILLQKVKEYGIRSLKLVAPFANIDDMWGREMSIYLRPQNPEEQKRIAEFISAVEDAFRENGIIPTPDIQREEANKKIKNSKFFSFRNEYANNPPVYYFSADKAKTLAHFLNAYHKELAEYYRSDNAQKEKLGNLLGSLTPSKSKEMMVEIEKLYKVIGIELNVPLSDFFEQAFRQFLEKNISIPLVAFLSPPHSSHNPFKLQDKFELEACNLTRQAAQQQQQGAAVGPTGQAVEQQPLLPAFSASITPSPLPAKLEGREHTGKKRKTPPPT